MKENSNPIRIDSFFRPYLAVSSWPVALAIHLSAAIGLAQEKIRIAPSRPAFRLGRFIWLPRKGSLL